MEGSYSLEMQPRFQRQLLLLWSDKYTLLLAGGGSAGRREGVHWNVSAKSDMGYPPDFKKRSSQGDGTKHNKGDRNEKCMWVRLRARGESDLESFYLGEGLAGGTQYYVHKTIFLSSRAASSDRYARIPPRGSILREDIGLTHSAGLRGVTGYWHRESEADDEEEEDDKRVGGRRSENLTSKLSGTQDWFDDIVKWPGIMGVDVFTTAADENRHDSGGDSMEHVNTLTAGEKEGGGVIGKALLRPKYNLDTLTLLGSPLLMSEARQLCPSVMSHRTVSTRK
ncbi:unnamed protein product [Pleuronectes platessa]|uniref:Uncharacterized protein n=1 Tax=Pleuronectes platessa TaxID=8262 RepID=A0A9N7YP13_PLEPL|nr:unnamed protein product [Pleuronectes platessa]